MFKANSYTLKHPHVLLLWSDEHRADVLGCEGNTVVRTPVLDGLAQRGTYFRSAYCTSPVCVPSRQSFHTGKLPREIGCLKFGDPFDSNLLTFPEHLARHGYQTVAYGKMHFEDVDQMHGWRQRPMGDVAVRIPSSSEVKDMPGLSQAERNAKGQGFWGPAKEVRNARAVPTGSGRLHEENLTDEACHFLKDYFADPHYDRPQDDRPLCFCLSLSNPHYPFQCPEDLLEYYMLRVDPKIESPPNDHPCHNQYRVRVGEDVTEREVRRATAAYYGQVEVMDRCYGRLLDTLEHLGVLDDFVIMYWSDHGEMLGQHGLWEKKQFYDASARVPLLVVDPRRDDGGGQVDDVVSLLDCFPTICELAAVPVPEDLSGASVLPLITGEAEGWRDEAVSELWSWYHGCDHRGCWMIRRGGLKYVYFSNPDYPEQLFDLDRDPNETENRIADPVYAEAVAIFRARSEELRKQGRSEA